MSLVLCRDGVKLTCLPAQVYKKPMPQSPTFSLIVPTRERTPQLRRMLDSVAATAAHPETIEIVLVVDVDDAASRDFAFEGLNVNKVTVPAGQPMGALNMAGYEASAGAYLMLLNDDVIARTRRWDCRVLACLRRFPDGIVLVHVNDRLFGQQLCAFPIVSRAFCEVAGGICPRDYRRYRIDDHIEDIFNLLWALGECRTVYMADVVFEHLNYVAKEGSRTYVPDEAVLALDAPLFAGLFHERKELAMRLMARIVEQATPGQLHDWRVTLEAIEDPFALRVPERHRVECAARKLRNRMTARLRSISVRARQAAILALKRAFTFLHPASDSPAATTSATAPGRRAS
jgi:Glycosyltransferase like family 2